MIGPLLERFTGKSLVLYNKHRQTIPLRSHEENRKKYVFIEMTKIWRYIPFKSSNKMKYRVIYLLLNLFIPKFIIDINWISRQHCLYRLWTKHNPNSQFIVLQHGSYWGGVVTDLAHRYTNCDVFLTWGPYFTDLFKEMNHGKNVNVRSFGNPVYNHISRSTISYSSNNIGNILLAPSGIKGRRLKELYYLKEKLEELNFRIYLKEHNFQSQKFQHIDNMHKVYGSAVEVLSAQKFDVIISDHSSIMLDAIFFKNRVLFFSGPDDCREYTDNKFTDYLDNLYFTYKNLKTKSDLYKCVHIDRQEALLNIMVSYKSNKLSIE